MQLRFVVTAFAVCIFPQAQSKAQAVDMGRLQMAANSFRPIRRNVELLLDSISPGKLRLRFNEGTDLEKLLTICRNDLSAADSLMAMTRREPRLESLYAASTNMQSLARDLWDFTLNFADFAGDDRIALAALHKYATSARLLHRQVDDVSRLLDRAMIESLHRADAALSRRP